MKQTLDQFVQYWTTKGSMGIKADYDGQYGGECVDLYNYYMRDVLDLDPYRYGAVNGAKDLATQLKKYPELEWHTGTPPKGAIVVFSGEIGGGYGHVGIMMSIINDKFRILDQIGNPIESRELPPAIRNQTAMKPYLLGYAIKGEDMYKDKSAKYWYDRYQDTVEKLNTVREERSKLSRLIAKIKSLLGVK